MLVYVVQLSARLAGARALARSARATTFPKTIAFSDWQLLPSFQFCRQSIGPLYVNLGAVFAVVAALVLAFLMGRTLKGFELRVLGQAPRAGRFAGFSREKIVWFCFLLSGGLAGLAGICEVMSTVGQLQPVISPGYGFTAIIVAFLGRLNPIGALVAAFALAISYLGGEAAQMALGISDKTGARLPGHAAVLHPRLRLRSSSTALKFIGSRAAAGGGPRMNDQLLSIILTIITASTPLLLAAIGELVVERSGVLNLGVEGMMVMGAVCGFGAALMTGSPLLRHPRRDRRRHAACRCSSAS